MDRDLCHILGIEPLNGWLVVPWALGVAVEANLAEEVVVVEAKLVAASVAAEARLVEAEAVVGARLVEAEVGLEPELEPWAQ